MLSTSSKIWQLILIITPLRKFKGREEIVKAVTVFPDKRRMVAGSDDKVLRLRDLKSVEDDERASQCHAGIGCITRWAIESKRLGNRSTCWDVQGVRLDLNQLDYYLLSLHFFQPNS